jgi:adenine-specific DNA-methyltransferase
MRPEVGTQTQFKKKKPPQTYRYDSSLSPVLEWDGQNPVRDEGEKHIAEIAGQARRLAKMAAETKNKEMAAEAAALHTSADKLKSLGKPFLNWAGKAERLSFDVPTLPLFVHERLSTKAIIETLKGHQTDKQEDFLSNLFADPRHSVTDQVLRAYEYKDNWVNRLILGDSLVVMNSLLHYESLGGQVQMIYMDPPYGVKFGSNFQPFVRKRDVSHGDDEDMTREPEMVQAYRDTWELGLHSYLTYMRDRLLLARDLLAPSGSIFVQISDENLHHVRELMDEVFGAENFCSVITFRKTTSATSELVPPVSDYLLWYARDIERVKFRQLYLERAGEGWVNYNYVRLADGKHRRMTADEAGNWKLLPEGARVYRRDNLVSGHYWEEGRKPFAFAGKEYSPGANCWKTNTAGLQRLAEADRLEAYGQTLSYRRFAKDFPYMPVSNLWEDTLTGGYAEDRIYVVQTITKVVERCLLMTTDPGDLVLDPTCGSGTTAYVAEQWGRRWITMDTSRVPLALARQRLLTATFPYYALKDEARGPAGGFVYKRKQNAKGEEVGGIVPHVTLKSIANNEPPAEEVLVDRPETVNSLVRVSGPLTVEATIPTVSGFEFQVSSGEAEYGNWKLETRNYFDRMLEVLRKSPVLRLEGNRTVTLTHIRPPAKTLSLSAEAMQEVKVSSFEFPVSSGGGENVAQVSGPDRLAKGHGTGGGSLPGQSNIPEGGSVRADQPDAARGGISSQQRGGRSGAAQPEGVSPVSGAGAGFTAGSGDAGGIGASSGIPVGGGSPGTHAAHAGSPAAAQRSDLETRHLKLETRPVAFVFGPENGAVSEKLVYEAAREAHAKNYTHLYVIGFAIQPNARELVEKSAEVIGVPATYVQATPDLMMGDLLKNMRSSQIFSVCGLPEIRISRKDAKAQSKETTYQVELLGLDVFDPVSMEAEHRAGNDVPCWMLDSDYNGLCFRATQVFFPRTSAWENLKKALKGSYEETVWDHLAGTTSAPFAAGTHGQVAVKVIDDRGNELLVVKKLE